MSKYQPLADHLAGLAADDWRASFAEVEAVLGFPLPKTALSSDGWWTGEDDKTHKRAWLDSGWRVTDLDRREGKVVFERLARAAAEPAPVAVVETPASEQPAQAKRAPVGLWVAVTGVAALTVSLGLAALRAVKRR
jgi:hypothetical protein